MSSKLCWVGTARATAGETPEIGINIISIIVVIVIVSNIVVIIISILIMVTQQIFPSGEIMSVMVFRDGNK